ncbi:MAG: diguanylate cyclase [Burkholderiaceae bacterium]
MSRLLSLRMRLVGGVMLVCLTLTAAAYFAMVDAANLARAQATPEQLLARETRLRVAISAQIDLLHTRLLKLAASPVDLEQLASGRSGQLLAALTDNSGSRNAWLMHGDGRLAAFIGAREGLTASAQARQLTVDAMARGESSGYVADRQGVALVTGLRLPVPLDDMLLFVARDIDDGFVSELAAATGLDLMMFRTREDGSLNRLGAHAAAMTSAALHKGLTPDVLGSLSDSRDLQIAGLDPIRLTKLAGTVYAASLPEGRSLTGMLDGTAQRVLIYCLIAVVALGAGAWLYSTRIVNGLKRLSVGARAFANGKYENVVTVGGSDELVRFAETFNLLGQTLSQREAKTFQTANRDSVTGLPSRTLFETKLVELLAVCRTNKTQLALITVAVDRLRDVNDSLGRKAGDVMLMEVSERIRKTLRISRKRSGSGTFVARLATYEFGIIAPEMDTDGARSLARRVAGARSPDRIRWSIGDAVGADRRGALSGSRHRRRWAAVFGRHRGQQRRCRTVASGTVRCFLRARSRTSAGHAEGARARARERRALRGIAAQDFAAGY